MSAANFYQAARPEPPRVIGLQLRPYSLGHHITLRAYDSSYVIGAEERFSDLVLGVFICSQSWNEWTEWKASWKLPAFLWLWGKLAGKFDLRKASQDFTRYIEEGMRCPEISVPTKGKELQGAWEARLKMFLIREMKCTAVEAMDYPLALAWQEYCAHNEYEGYLTLLSEAEIAALEERNTPEHKNRMAELVAKAEADAKAEAQKN